MKSRFDVNQGVYTVYQHITPDGWVYIGMTGKKPGYRWRNGTEYKHQPRFYSAIEMFGWENIKHEVVAQFTNKVEAHDVERKLIQLNKDHCYNVKSTSTSYFANWVYNKRKVLKEI